MSNTNFISSYIYTGETLSIIFHRYDLWHAIWVCSLILFTRSPLGSTERNKTTLITSYFINFVHIAVDLKISVASTCEYYPSWNFFLSKKSTLCLELFQFMYKITFFKFGSYPRTCNNLVQRVFLSHSNFAWVLPVNVIRTFYVV